MPFFSVRVLTGNSCDCVHAGEAAMLKAHNTNNAVQQYLIAFMNLPSATTLHS
jgi:hypothetical protein